MCVADRAISLGFGAAYRTVEDNIAQYVVNAYRGVQDRALTAGGVARHIEKAVGKHGFYLLPEQIMEWVSVFEERTGRQVLESVPGTLPPAYRCVYHKNIQILRFHARDAPL
jgi:hypothetical protein